MSFRRWALSIPLLLAILGLATSGSMPSLAASSALADEPTDSQQLTFTVAGDYGGNSATTATLNGIATAAPDFNLAIGDLSYDQITPESAWCSYVRAHIPPSIPFEILAGNHEDFSQVSDDVDGDGAGGGDIDQFTACLPDTMGATGQYGRQYYLDVPPQKPLARIIMTSPGLVFDGATWGYTRGQPRYNWVSTAIDDARAQQIPWIIVAAHKPCLTSGFQPCGPGRDLVNLLLDRKVDLLLYGHDHTYQRSQQLALSADCAAVDPRIFTPGCIVPEASDGSYTKGNGPVEVIVGTGGQGLTEINPASTIAPYFVAAMGKSSDNASTGFFEVKLSEQQLSGGFHATAGGTFADSFTIGTSAATAASIAP
jgi:hypothetical protein